jgi:prolyl-tRNA synthetase
MMRRALFGLKRLRLSKFAEWELIGVPIRVTVGDRGLKEGKFEVQTRRTGAVDMVAQADGVQLIQGLLAKC